MEFSMQGVYWDVPLGATPVEGMVESRICLAQGEVKYTVDYSLCTHTESSGARMHSVLSHIQHFATVWTVAQ